MFLAAVETTRLDNVLSVVVDGEDVVGEEVVHSLLLPVLHFCLLLADEPPHGKIVCQQGEVLDC